MTKRKLPGLGSKRGGSEYSKRIVISLKDDVFDEIRAKAIKNGNSFSAEVSDLINWGMGTKYEGGSNI